MSRQPLPPATRALLEASYRTDLSSVRVVPDSDEASHLGAEAFARGNEIHLAPGRFAPDDPRDHLLAHEVAHVVQQAQGRVAANVQAEGVALNTDESLEREADEMASSAISGGQARSGPALTAPEASDGAPAQGFFKLSAEDAGRLAERRPGTRFLRQLPGPNGNYLDDDRNLRTESTTQIPALRIADTGELAIQDTDDNVDVKTFFADASVIDHSNERLEEVGSTFALRDTGNKLTVPDIEGTSHELHQVEAERGEQRGTEVRGKSQCIEMAQQVMGGGGELSLGTANNVPQPSEKNFGNSLAAYVATYAETDGDEGAAVEASDEVNRPIVDKLLCPKFTVTIADDYTPDDVRQQADGETDRAGKHIFQVDDSTTRVPDQFIVRPNTARRTVEKTLVEGWCCWKVDLFSDIENDPDGLRITAEPGRGDRVWQKLLELYEDGELVALAPAVETERDRVLVTVRAGVPESDLEEVRTDGEQLERQIPEDRARDLLESRLGALITDAEPCGQVTFAASFYRGEDLQRRYVDALRDKKTDVATKLGINQHAAPGVGGAFAISSVGQMNEDGQILRVSDDEWQAPEAPYHWAGVVAKSGDDVITFENYARGPGEGMGDQDPRGYFAMYGPAREVDVRDDDSIEEQETTPEERARGTFHGTWAKGYPNPITVAYERS